MLNSPNALLTALLIAFGPPAQLAQLEADIRKSMSRGCLAFETHTRRVPVPVGRIDVMKIRK